MSITEISTYSSLLLALNSTYLHIIPKKVCIRVIIEYLQIRGWGWEVLDLDKKKKFEKQIETNTCINLIKSYSLCPIFGLEDNHTEIDKITITHDWR